MKEIILLIWSLIFMPRVNWVNGKCLTLIIKSMNHFDMISKNYVLN